jgi:hypothetical protein
MYGEFFPRAHVGMGIDHFNRFTFDIDHGSPVKL